jgi:hypothetical protein
MKSICLTCLIYTLKDRDVKDNQYIHIFYIWLAKVIQSGGLTSQDSLYIIMDQRTIDYHKANHTVLLDLIDHLPCPFSIVSVEPPQTQLEGMMNKYINIDYNEDVYIYCDIDILISNTFQSMISDMKDMTIYLCKEGLLSDKNYSEGFTYDTHDLPGFSAGKFIILGKDLRDSLFQCINDLCDYSTNFYSIEQPYFNRAIYNHPIDNINISYLGQYVSFNGDMYEKTRTIFNDVAGEPCDGKKHLDKIIHSICLYSIGFY